MGVAGDPCGRTAPQTERSNYGRGGSFFVLSAPALSELVLPPVRRSGCRFVPRDDRLMHVQGVGRLPEPDPGGGIFRRSPLGFSSSIPGFQTVLTAFSQGLSLRISPRISPKIPRGFPVFPVPMHHPARGNRDHHARPYVESRYTGRQAATARGLRSQGIVGEQGCCPTSTGVGADCEKADGVYLKRPPPAQAPCPRANPGLHLATLQASGRVALAPRRCAVTRA